MSSCVSASWWAVSLILQEMSAAELQGIDNLVPGPWNKKVTVELYHSTAPDPDSLWRDSVDLIPVTATKDAEGYDVTTQGTPRAVVAIFTRGVDGGCRLNRDLETVSLYDLLSIIEGGYEVNACMVVIGIERFRHCLFKQI